MAKPLSGLIKQIKPEVVQAAKVRAEQEIFEFRLAQLREQLEQRGEVMPTREFKGW